MTPTETGYHDVRGIPICVGDLIRVRHYRHYRRREQMWLYFIVGELSGRFVVYGWDRQNVHQCLLSDCGVESAEVLKGPSLADLMHNERPRKT